MTTQVETHNLVVTENMIHILEQQQDFYDELQSENNNNYNKLKEPEESESSELAGAQERLIRSDSVIINLKEDKFLIVTMLISNVLIILWVLMEINDFISQLFEPILSIVSLLNLIIHKQLKKGDVNVNIESMLALLFFYLQIILDISQATLDYHNLYNVMWRFSSYYVLISFWSHRTTKSVNNNIKLMVIQLLASSVQLYRNYIFEFETLASDVGLLYGNFIVNDVLVTLILTMSTEHLRVMVDDMGKLFRLIRTNKFDNNYIKENLEFELLAPNYFYLRDYLLIGTQIIIGTSMILQFNLSNSLNSLFYIILSGVISGFLLLSRILWCVLSDQHPFRLSLDHMLLYVLWFLFFILELIHGTKENYNYLPTAISNNSYIFSVLSYWSIPLCSLKRTHYHVFIQSITTILILIRNYNFELTTVFGTEKVFYANFVVFDIIAVQLLSLSMENYRRIIRTINVRFSELSQLSASIMNI